MRAALVVLVIAVVACGGATDIDPTASSDPGSQRFPDVVEVEYEVEADGDYRFDVTLSSPYDTPDRYADAWRILDTAGNVLGVRELLHDHGNEQPFTRSLGDVAIPDDVDTVTVQARDLVNGWGGATVEVEIRP